MAADGVPIGERDAAPMWAYFDRVPDTHDGTDAFSVRLRFGEDVDTTTAALRDSVITVSGGTVTAVEAAAGSTRNWTVTVVPDGDSDVAVSVGSGLSCADLAAVCTADGRTLPAGIEVTVAGPSAAVSLDALSLDGALLDQAFDPEVTLYTAQADVGVSQVTVAAVARDAAASVDILPADADPNTAGHQVEIAEYGLTEVTVTVTADNGAGSNRYVVTFSGDHEATTSTGGSVAVGGSVRARVDSAGDRDWFAVDLVADSVYRIDLKGKSSASDSLVDPYVFGVRLGDGTMAAGTSDDDSGDGENSAVWFVASATGTHFVDVGAHGSGTGIYELSVFDVTDGVPEQPGAPSVTVLSATSVRIEWEAPGDGGSPITGYGFVMVGPRGWFRAVDGSLSLQQQTTGLVPGTEYGVSIWATNVSGDSKFSYTTSFLMPVLDPPDELAVRVTPTATTVGGGEGLDLSSSVTGSDGASETFRWSSRSGLGTFSDEEAPDPIWTAPAATSEIQYVTLTLSVSDDSGGSDSATAVVTVLAASGSLVPPLSEPVARLKYAVERLLARPSVQDPARRVEQVHPWLRQAWDYANHTGAYADLEYEFEIETIQASRSGHFPEVLFARGPDPLRTVAPHRR